MQYSIAWGLSDLCTVPLEGIHSCHLSGVLTYTPPACYQVGRLPVLKWGLYVGLDPAMTHLKPPLQVSKLLPVS